jgi:CheY-like chemotaxis protein
VRDVIIKPLSFYLPKVVGLVEATVLGNGDVAPVVDVGDLLSEQSNVIGKLNIESSAELEETHQASVLVVEDSISTRRSLAEFMQDLNYKVYTAKDGVEAIEIMRDHSPTLLLTDLEMPRMNGLELTSYVRAHDETKDIPIIMLTSRTTEKHRKEAMSIGVNEYLSKPFVEDVLLEKVQSLVNKK